MKDTFDLKKYIKEAKTMERSNPYLAESIQEDEFRAKVKEMVLNELGKDQETDLDYSDDLDEAKKDEEVEDVDIDIEDTDIEDTASESGSEDIMGHLKAAFDMTDDEKLKTQIGNTITMLTKEIY